MSRARRLADEAIEKYAIMSGDFALSSGARSDTYVDCRAAMLKDQAAFSLYLWEELNRYRNAAPVATGTSGALMLGLIGWGYLWNPKGHGVEWSPRPAKGTSVVLFDDVVTTHGTLDRLRAACEAAGLVVAGEVVLYDRREKASGVDRRP
jgi:orotate phosphoribosyltransferase